MANQNFENHIKPYFKDIFTKCKSKSIDEIDNIEGHIRLTILENIIKNIQSNLKNKTSEYHEPNQLLNFIEKNKFFLIAGNYENLEAIRPQLNSNSNCLHIAWRAYDPYAPALNWPNLFTDLEAYADEEV
ncbi:MAG: hypothetical protein JWM09_301 [Francisellaceae bacterium]|nr:hypothetical protein [Francisellaceae bacterium]